MLPTLLVLIAGVLWSFSGILIKEIHWNALAIAGVRSLIGGTLQFGFLVFSLHLSSKNSTPARKKQPLLEALMLACQRLGAREPAHWLGAVSFVLNMVALVWAFQLTTAATAVFLHYSGIVLVALFSLPVLKQTLTKQDWLAVFLAFAGIALLSIDGLRLDNLLGTALGISCAITMATTQICLGLRAKTKTAGTEALETIVLANALMVLIAIPSMLTAPLMMPQQSAWLFLILLGIVPWGVPDILYASAIKQVPVFRAMVLGLSDPVLTAVWPLLLLSEVPSPLALTGAAIIMAAIVYQSKYSIRISSV